MVFWIGTNVGFWTSYVSSHKSSRHVPSFYRLVVEDISSAGAGRYTCQVVLLVSFKNQRRKRWLVTEKRRHEGRSKRKKTASLNLSLILTSIRVIFFSHISPCHSFWSVFLLLCHQELCIFRSFKLFVRARNSNTCPETNGEVMNNELYCCSVRQPLWSLRHFKSPCVQLLVFLLSAGLN